MPIEPIPPTRAVDDELAHVRNVEDADIVPHCLMFLGRCWCIAPALASRRMEPSSRQAACARRKAAFFLCAASLTGQAKRRCDHAQRWIGFSEDDEIIALRTTRSTLHANCATLPCASNDLAG
jgi:hypothetical protein